TRRLVNSANRRPRSAGTPSCAATFSIASSRLPNPCFFLPLSRSFLSHLGNLRRTLAPQNRQQLITRAMHRTGTQRDYQVAFPHVVAKNLAGVVERADVLGVLVTITLDASGQYFGVHALNRLLARGVNIRDQEHVGIVEGAGKLVHQIVRARVAVRLKQDDDAPVWCADARSAERGFDL